MVWKLHPNESPSATNQNLLERAAKLQKGGSLTLSGHPKRSYRTWGAGVETPETGMIWKMIFIDVPFPKVGYVNSLEGIIYLWTSQIPILTSISAYLLKGLVRPPTRFGNTPKSMLIIPARWYPNTFGLKKTWIFISSSKKLTDGYRVEYPDPFAMF